MSDGVNEDFGIIESCGRLEKIIEDCRGKKFVLFKTSFSPVRSADLIARAREAGGVVLPFFIMSYYQDFYDYLLPRRKELMREQYATKKEIDIGFYANLIETGENGKPEYFAARRKFFDLFSNSRFSFAHKNKTKYDKFLKDSFKWRVCFSPPGYGEYTPRMLEHAALGQAVVIRKSSYDNAVSYKGAFAEIDFSLRGWENELQKVIDNREEWGKKALAYFDENYNPAALVRYLLKKVDEYA
jgi:hypothetical protein